jgi:flagellar secretion chaperone FliS
MTIEANHAYREAEALTTDPVGLVVVLYDMLLTDLHQAVAALAENDIERRAKAIRHSMLVLQQLQSTLDMERGGVVAVNLERFYNFIRAKLLEGQIKASPEILTQQITLVASIRDAWQQVRSDQLAASTTSEDPPPGVTTPFEANPGSLSQWTA